MADLQITDTFGLSTTLQLRDDSPIAKAKITHLAAIRQALGNDIHKPIDETSFKEFSFGVNCSTPKVAIAEGATVTAGGGVCGEISIVRPADKTVFPDDDFSLNMSIAPDQCWIGVGFDTSVNANAQASMDGFGVGIKDTSELGLRTYTLVDASGGKFPSFIDGLKTALDGFYLASSAEALRNQPAGAVCVHEVSGTVTFTASYQLPVSVNALASADLPFNYKIKLQPQATLKLSGSIALCGDMIVRLHKVAQNILELGVYKKRGSTLTASFTAKAGMGLDEGTTDLAPAFLSAVFPGVDCKKAGITGDAAKNLNGALKDSVDRSLSIGMNICCSAESTNEAAMIYQIDLDAGDKDATDAALKDALRGNWTGLSQLTNATPRRNIVTDSNKYKHTIAMNLFGIYNAAAVDSYLQSCTILCDPHGQVVVTDKSNASRISVATMPYAADPDKLRSALAQDFLVTAAYTAVAANLPVNIQASSGTGSEVEPTLTMRQSYICYKNRATRQEMQNEILLGTALRLIDQEQKQQFWDGALAGNRVFPHAHISASAKYSSEEVMRLFFADPDQREPRTPLEIEQAGRDAMIALIDPGDPAGPLRRKVLQDDTIWKAMDSNGNAGAFGTLQGLDHLSEPALADVRADWTAIRWWTDAMLQAAPKLADLIAYLETIPVEDFSHNPEFIARTKDFQSVLGEVAKKTRARFVDGWGMAVVLALAGSASQKSMDIGWTNAVKHYESSA